jgi:hypothetical protein
LLRSAQDGLKGRCSAVPFEIFNTCFFQCWFEPMIVAENRLAGTLLIPKDRTFVLFPSRQRAYCVDYLFA